MIKTPIHTNETYNVYVKTGANVSVGGTVYPDAYEAVNRETGVTEFISPSLPEVLYTCESFNHALISEAWKWRREESPKQTMLDLVN